VGEGEPAAALSAALSAADSIMAAAAEADPLLLTNISYVHEATGHGAASTVDGDGEIADRDPGSPPAAAVPCPSRANSRRPVLSDSDDSDDDSDGAVEEMGASGAAAKVAVEGEDPDWLSDSE
jgi:hypothetical protein